MIDHRLTDITNSLYRLSAKAVIIRDGKLLCVQEDKEEWWGLPGGGIDYGETYQQAIVRELQEELCIPASALLVRPGIILFASSEVYGNLPRAQLYLRVDLTGAEPKAGHGIISLDWFLPGEVKSLKASTSLAAVREDLIDYLTVVK